MSKKGKRRIWCSIDIVNRNGTKDKDKFNPSIDEAFSLNNVLQQDQSSHDWIDIGSDEQRSGEHAGHCRSHSCRIQLDREITSVFRILRNNRFKSMINKVHDGTISVRHEEKFSIFIAQSLETNQVTVIDDVKLSGKNKEEFFSPKELDSGATNTDIFALHPPSSSFEFELVYRMVKALQIKEIVISRYLTFPLVFSRSVQTVRCIVHCCEYLDDALNEKCVTNVRQDFETSISLIVRLFIRDESHRFENEEMLENLPE